MRANNLRIAQEWGDGLIVAAGGHPTNSYSRKGYSPGVIGREIRPPEHFGHLLAEAERDLGSRVHSPKTMPKGHENAKH